MATCCLCAVVLGTAPNFAKHGTFGKLSPEILLIMQTVARTSKIFYSPLGYGVILAGSVGMDLKQSPFFANQNYKNVENGAGFGSSGSSRKVSYLNLRETIAENVFVLFAQLLYLELYFFKK